MTLKLKDFLKLGGYQEQIFAGYFRPPHISNQHQNGNGKSLFPYKLQALSPGKNPQILLARLDIYEFKSDVYRTKKEDILSINLFSRIRSLDDFVSVHLYDPLFDPSKYRTK